MAIDTENKRRSALLRIATPLPVPDSVIGILDRPHVLSIYAGISIALPVEITTPSCRTFIPALEARSFAVPSETRTYTPGCE